MLKAWRPKTTLKCVIILYLLIGILAYFSIPKHLFWVGFVDFLFFQLFSFFFHIFNILKLLRDFGLIKKRNLRDIILNRKKLN